MRADELELIRTLRAQGREGAVPVLDSRARRLVVHPERLLCDPEVLGYGADPLGDAATGPAPQAPLVRS